MREDDNFETISKQARERVTQWPAHH